MEIKTKGQDWKKTAIYLVVYMAAVVIGAYLLFTIYWHIWALIVVIGLIFLIRWHSKAAVYRCTNCGNEFQVSFITDFLSPQGLGKDDSGKTYGWKYLKCPHCGKKMKAVIIKMK